MNIELAKKKINNFIREHSELFTKNNYEVIGQTHNWDKGERFWCESINKENKYLFYFLDQEIDGVYDRSYGLNKKIY